MIQNKCERLAEVERKVDTCAPPYVFACVSDLYVRKPIVKNTDTGPSKFQVVGTSQTVDRRCRDRTVAVHRLRGNRYDHRHLQPQAADQHNSVYLKHDVPALSLAGTKKWWPRKMIERYAVTHLFLTVGAIRNIVERIADAVMETQKMISEYCNDVPEFREVGERMIATWKEGVGTFEK